MPFGAMEENNGKLNITAGCRLHGGTERPVFRFDPGV